MASSRRAAPSPSASDSVPHLPARQILAGVRSSFRSFLPTRKMRAHGRCRRGHPAASLAIATRSRSPSAPAAAAGRMNQFVHRSACTSRRRHATARRAFARSPLAVVCGTCNCTRPAAAAVRNDSRVSSVLTTRVLYARIERPRADRCACTTSFCVKSAPRSSLRRPCAPSLARRTLTASSSRHGSFAPAL